MRKIVQCVAAVVLGIGSIAQPASASAQVTVLSYQGIIYSGTDWTGLFGEAGSLVGAQASVDMYFDYSLGEFRWAQQGLYVYGMNDALQSPGLFATVTVNGVTQQIAGPRTEGFTMLGTVIPLTPTRIDQINSYNCDPNNVVPCNIGRYAEDYVTAWFQSYSGDRGMLSGYDPTYLNHTPGLSNNVEFRFTNYNPDTNNNDVWQAEASFHVSSFSIRSAVPEPSTWATMLLGFGAIGWQMRRKRVFAQDRSLNSRTPV